MLRLAKLISFCTLIFLSPTACGPAHKPDINGTRARELVQQGAILVDVRSSVEFWWSHNEGAVNISYGDLPEKMTPFSKTRAIIVYSRSGARSAKARDLLSAAGFLAYDLGAKDNW